MPPEMARLLAGAEWERNQEGEAGASVYRVRLAGGEALYLKFGTGRVAHDVADEAARLRWLAGRIPSTRVRLFTCTEDAAWLLTEVLPGLTGDQWLAREPGRWPLIVRGLAGYMRRLHALPVDECPFDAGQRVTLAAAARNVADGIVDEDDFDPERLGRTAESVLEEALRLAPDRPGRVVTHGDFSLGNFVLDEAGAVTGCIDVGRLGVANRYQDIAILWGNLREVDHDAPRLLLQELGIAEVDERKLLFHLCLNELF